MAKKRRARDEAWAHAKQICRLTTRQVEMARTLGMNPRKLPGLRPSPQQRWKLPVGQFIEECHRKRFGEATRKNDPRASEPSSSKPPPNWDMGEPRSVRDAGRQLSDLVCYFMNLANDLEAWLAHGSVDPDVLSEVREELQEIVQALDTGAPVPQIPGISVPPPPSRRGRTRRDDPQRTFDDDIPF